MRTAAPARWERGSAGGSPIGRDPSITAARYHARVSETVDDIRAPARRPLLLRFGAGVGGGAWTALMQIVATPFYLRLLGVESYGLIGFYTALQALLQVLDMGISLMTSREVARL